MTCCCAWAPAATSTRPTGCGSRARTSTSRPRPRWSRCSRTSARRSSTPAGSRRWWTSSCRWASSGSRTSRCPRARRSRPGCARSARRGWSAATAASRRQLQERLDYELGVIISMGYAGYFLIVADFVRFAREQGIATTCRGSAPGSIVTYTLGITPVDPLHYGLPFERFLNPDRVTMPDIDVDFEDERRDEVINYVSRKYGQDHVAQIITFGTMLARAAIRDVGRVLGMSYGDVDRIAKAVPNQLGIKLEEALQISPQLKEMQDGDPQIAKLLDLAQQLEGVARNASTHAAGVVISREPLTELMPLQKATNSDALMTQYEMHAHRGAGPAQVRLPGPVQPHHPAQGRGAHPRPPGRRGGPGHDPARRREDVRAARLGRDDGRVPAGVRGHAALHPRAPAVLGVRPGGHGRAVPARPDGQHPVVHPAQARPGARHLPPPAAGAVPGADLRDLRVPGGHHGRGHGPRRVHGSRGGHAGLRDPQEEVVGPALDEGQVRHPGRRARRPAPDDRRRVQGVRAVRALRLQQGPRHLLRADRLPDRLPQGELHRRVHDLGAHRVPRQRGEGRRGRRGVPAHGHRRANAGRPSLAPRLHRRGRGDPVRAARGQERGRRRHRVDHPGARGGRRVPVAHGLLHAGGPAPCQPEGARVADPGRCAQRPRAPGPGPARPRRRARRRPGGAAGPDQRPDVAVRHGRRGGGDPGAAAARHAGDAGARAAPLGEGADGALPLGSPDGRGRGPGRRLRHRVQRRSQGRVARRPARGPGRDRDRDAHASSPRRARRWPW